MTPEKQEVLWEKLVELKGTPGKDGEAPEKRGEPEKRIRKFLDEKYQKIQDETREDFEILRKEKREKRLTVVIIIALLIFLYFFEVDFAKHTVRWGWCILPCLAIAVLIGAGGRFLYEKFSLRYKAKMELRMKQMDKMFRPLVKIENFKNKYEAIIFLQYFHRKPWQLRLLQFLMWIYITVAFGILGDMFDIVIPEGWSVDNFKFCCSWIYRLDIGATA